MSTFSISKINITTRNTQPFPTAHTGSTSTIQNQNPRLFAASVDFIFLLYDAGETNALLPTIQELIKENEIIVYILGVGSLNVIKKFFPSLGKQFLQITHPGTPEKRFERMGEKDLQELGYQYLPSSVITGCVSSYQQQLCQYYKANNSNVKVRIMYDSLSENAANLLLPFKNDVDEILVPSSNIPPKLVELGFTPQSIHVVGQPAIDKFTTEARGSYPENIKKQLAEINIYPKNKIITFVGGYGENYPQIFGDFIIACKDLTDEISFLISLHPSQSGSTESDIIHGMIQNKKITSQQAENFYLLSNNPSKIEMIKGNSPSTAALVKISNLIVTQNSTVGVQALYANVPCIYFDTINTKYTDIALNSIENPSVTRQIINPKYLTYYLKNYFPEKKDNKRLPFPVKIIPPNATTTILKLLKKME